MTTKYYLTYWVNHKCECLAMSSTNLSSARMEMADIIDALHDLKPNDFKITDKKGCVLYEFSSTNLSEIDRLYKIIDTMIENYINPNRRIGIDKVKEYMYENFRTWLWLSLCGNMFDTDTYYKLDSYADEKIKEYQ